MLVGSKKISVELENFGWVCKYGIQYILTYLNPFVQAKNIFVRITENFRYVKYIEKYITESSITI